MITIQFKPTKKQFKAWNYLTDSKTNEILYGGGARGGKSWLGCSWIIIQALAFPASAWLIGRNELKRIKSTTLRTFFKVCQDWGMVNGAHYTYNAQQETITFYNHSVVFLVDLKDNPSDPEFDRLGSYDLTGAFIDEAQEVSIKAINVLKGRFSLLEGAGWKTIPKTLMTCNPRKNWIYIDFYKPHKENRLSPERVFIPSLVTDNPYVTKEYIDNLRRADTVTVQRLLYGNFEYDDDPGVLMSYDHIVSIFGNELPRTKDMYCSCDVARKGGDSTTIGIWDGLTLIDIRVYRGLLTNETAEQLSNIQREYNIPRSHFIIDEDGVGGGVLDHFTGAKGFINNSQAIQPPQAQYDQTKRVHFANLKSQCYFLLADYVNAKKVAVGAIPSDVRDRLVEELEFVRQVDTDKETALRVLPKEQIKEYLGRSPDLSDMMMMRMYFELHKQAVVEQEPSRGGIKSFDIYD